MNIISKFIKLEDKSVVFGMMIRKKLQHHFKKGYAYFGKNSVMWNPDRIIGKKRIEINDNVTILHHARIEVLKDGYLSIGKNTSIEERSHVIAASHLSIGSETVISADVYISDCNHGYNRNKPIIEQELEIKPTKIGNHCFVGIGAKIMPGVELGDYCVVGANSVVTHSFPEGSIIAGVPAKKIRDNN